MKTAHKGKNQFLCIEEHGVHYGQRGVCYRYVHHRTA